MAPIDIASGCAVFAMAFAIGFAIRRGSICLVDASYQWVVNGKALRIKAFAIAAAAAGCVILPLAWLMPGKITHAPSYPLSSAILLGGGMFGLGARINGGCAFGTLAHLSGGRLEFTGTLAGAALGASIVSAMADFGQPAEPLFAKPELLGAAALLAFAMIALPAVQKRHLQNLRSILTNRRALLRPFTAMLIIGVLGGVLFAAAGSWTHLSFIHNESAFLTGSAAMGADGRAAMGALALLSGAVFAAWRSGRMQIEWPSLTRWSLCCLGGALMGSAAALIPGGNGALIVFGVPSGSLSASVAVAAMVAMLALSFARQGFAKRR